MEQCVLARDDFEFGEIIRKAELIIPDGASVVLAFNYLFRRNEPRIKKLAGIDLAEKLLQEKNRVAILGSRPNVVEKLRQKYKNKLVFAHHGYFSLEEAGQIAEKISKAQPEILLVGMGAPLQEKFIDHHKNLFQNTICMGVGGTLEVFAGLRLRAPKLFVALNLEWLFRLIQEPSRLKRILEKVPRYLYLLVFCGKKG
jgi:N-acetylglucosaminyldiphosphoundecaprenol N-acetyl-beta-D-mannosaminyltransferase